MAFLEWGKAGMPVSPRPRICSQVARADKQAEDEGDGQ